MSKMSFLNKTVALLLIGLAVLGFSVACDRVSGEKTGNQPPQVYFVNIPPDGHQTSFDPVVYWVGTDSDGLVEMFRYIVVRIDEMGAFTDPDDYIANVLMTRPSGDWTYLNVTTDQTQTTNIIPMSASLDDPINTYVQQYVFLQAFDDQGAGSQVVYRLFERNDNPPTTRFTGADYVNRVFINSVEPGGAITGVRFQISASDPDEADSLFEFRWRLYGPYASDSVNGGDWEALLDTFVVPIYVTADARVIPRFRGLRDTLIDTILEPGQTTPTIDTTIYNPDTMPETGIFGYKDNIFDIDSLDGHPTLFRPVDSSRNDADLWISDNLSPTYRDSVFDIFRTFISDTTTQQRFMLWGQTRDAAEVADVAPAFVSFQCVDPKYERDILVIDRQSTSGRIVAPPWNRAQNLDVSRDYFADLIDAWGSQRTENIVFEPDRDYIHTTLTGDNVPLGRMLGYKVIILYNDGAQQASIDNFGSPTVFATNLWTAIDAGVNVWGTMRSIIRGGSQEREDFNIVPSPQYTNYFGISRMVHSGWTYWSQNATPSGDTLRIEDFIGALSLKLAEGWPDIKIDTANLHSRYTWLPNTTRKGTFAWDCLSYRPCDLFALPEVNWSVRVFGTEPLYLYESYYGPSHPFGTDWTYDGAPVAIRYETNLYRTAHFHFTPLGMEDATMQVIADSVLNWLYDPTLGTKKAPVSGNRYMGAKVHRTLEETRANFERRWQELYPPEEAEMRNNFR